MVAEEGAELEKTGSNFQFSVLVDAGGPNDTCVSAGCSRSVVLFTDTHCRGSHIGLLFVQDCHTAIDVDLAMLASTIMQGVSCHLVRGPIY